MDRNDSNATPTATMPPRRRSTLDLQALKADDPDIAIANNMEMFERKFRMQQRELAEEVRRIVHHHGDLIVKAIADGPHEKIIDPVRSR